MIHNMSKQIPENTAGDVVLLSRVVWRCPVCLKIPPGQIFQCSGGHSFCHACIFNAKTCPKCDVKMFGSKHGFYGVRNLLAESLLNQLKFECCWKNQGCETLETRTQISKHESACIYRPINLCNRFSGSMDCKFQTHLYKSLDVDEVLKHIKTAHGKLHLQTGVEFGSNCLIEMDERLRHQLQIRTQSYIVPAFVEVIHFTNESYPEPSKELFIILRKVEAEPVGPPQGNASLSWLFVWLTSETNKKRFSVKMKITIKGEPKACTAVQNGNDCVPDVSWTLNSISAREFAEWKLCRNQKLDFPFSLPLSHINKHYMGSDDIFTVSFTFLKELL